MPQALEVPTFTYGTYTSLDGEDVVFTDDLMRDLVKNTNYAIAVKALTPPVGYDTINNDGTYAHRGTEAHAHVTAAKFRNGVVTLELSKPSEQFRSDVKEGRRLRVSGEFNPKFSYTDASGKKIDVGPTIVGLAALGRHRPALKNPSIVPLSDLNFGESIAPADAYATREELRKSGFVAQTLADGKYAFSEINVDPIIFGEQEQGMTDAEIQAAIDAKMKPLNEKITTLEGENTKLKGDVLKFSETSKREGAAKSFCEKLATDRKATAPLPVLFTEKLETILADPTLTDAQITLIKSLAESAPGAYVGGKSKDADDKDADGDDKAEPKALAKLKPRDFAEMSSNPDAEARIEAGIIAFGEFQKDAYKGAENNSLAQIERLRRHIEHRDLGTN